MKITHVALVGIVTDYWTYQDNLLPKYHKKNGYDVSIITSHFVYKDNGKIGIDNRKTYINENGIKTIRLSVKNNKWFTYKFKRFPSLYKTIEKEEPNIIFVHGCQFVDLKVIEAYVENNPEVKLYIDNHADFNNSGTNWISKNILHKCIWRYYAKRIEPLTTKFYGVLPARVDFLINVYKLNKEKVELLVMGVDDENVIKIKNEIEQQNLRKEHNVLESDFLIVTGGKIDNNKKEILLLMEAIAKLYNPKIKLLVFGSISEELNESFQLLLNDNVKYTGWIQPTEVNKYLYTADLVMFPGLHSVLWEQSVGLGKPCVFRFIEGFQHVDLGGNCMFLEEHTVSNYCDVVMNIFTDKNLYENMKNTAVVNGRKEFSYNEIAKKSIEE